VTRDEALKLVKEKIKNENLVKHCLAVEACMRALAQHFDEEEEKWALAGLLHDIDYEETKHNPEKHSLIGAKMLEGLGLDKEIVEAVKTHNEMHGIAPESRMAKALYSVDPLTGLIVAAVLVLPSKKISDLTTESVARGANREIIKKCEDTGLPLDKFIEIGLDAMKGIDKDLGL
jgi:putative nucleotidyltransferase with HDIG domain